VGKIIDLRKGVAPAPARRRRTAPPRTDAQMVYESLRRKMMCLELAPGSALEESQLCRAFHVSRTPVREALIRLASEGLAELNPNRGARVSSIGFVDVVDHYEAMDVFLPVACHFAAVRRTPKDLAEIRMRLSRLEKAVERMDSAAIIGSNYDFHSAIASACHNRCIERGYRQMLADKQRLAQHGLPGTTFDKGQALADRFRGTARLSSELVRAIGGRRPEEARRLGRELNEFVRGQVIGVLSASLGKQIEVPLPAAVPRRPQRPLTGQKKRNRRAAFQVPPKEEGGGDWS
jgi:DNA-binding GntR family transcriptional regulator